MKLNIILIAGFLIVALLVGGVGLTSTSQFTKILDPLEKEIPESLELISATSRLDGLAQFIRYYDEVLTQSARNYAFTQDKKWEQRYRDVEPELDSIIKEAIEKGDQADKEFFSSVDAANLALVAMEYNAIDLVNQERAEEAVKILESDEYWKQKDIYELGLRNYVSRRGKTYDEALTVSVEKVDFVTEDLVSNARNIVLIFVIAAFGLSILLGILISKSISKPIKSLTNNVDEISKGNFDIKLEESKISEIKSLTSSLNRILASMKLAVLKVGIKKEDIGVGTKEVLKAKKKAENALKESEKKYKILFEKSIDGIFIIDDKGNLLDANEACAKMHGYTLEEFMKLDLKKLEGPETIKLMPERMKKVLSGVSFRFETTHYHKDRHVFPLEVSVSLVVMKGKKAIIAFHRDITKKNKAEQTLKESQEKYRDLFENANDLIQCVDKDGNFVY
ncbi:PAS domain S-box protein, partial [Candidatus Woesearchaeota archaeon]|nr:PAS domain S-box protein [Candidatus Woesearchaeota archaeon]